MLIKVSRKLNDYATATFEIDERDTDLALLQMAFFAEEPRCWLKGFEEAKVKWNVRKAGDNQEYTYVEMVARTKDRKAVRTMGKYKTGGMFWKNWKEYMKGSDGKWIEVTTDNLSNSGTPVQSQSKVQGEIEYPTEQVNAADIPF